MEPSIVRIESIYKITHDVLRIVTTKPGNYFFKPGQATDVSINKKYWDLEKRPFTFTSLPGDNNLEFIIKTYSLNKGVTNEMLKLKEGDELIIHDAWGAISYQGKGVFIAGGAGITPFISILRHLASINEIGGNLLLFANKRRADIIFEDEFRSLLGNSYINILSEENIDGCFRGFITESLLLQHIKGREKKYYVCGPPPMMNSVLRDLLKLGAADHSIIVEM